MTVFASETQIRSARRPGLDSLRFILALWVVFDHLGFLPMQGLRPGGSAPAIGRLLWDNLFSGPAAVIVFFVISGFCIHYPYRNGRPFDLAPYLLRRNVRIWIPAAAMLGLSRLVGLNIDLTDRTILWSLVAEEVYYVIYPLIRRFAQRYGWNHAIAIAYACCLMVVLRDPAAKNFPSFGVTLNWIVGLPSWILGCIIAERIDGRLNNRVVGSGRIWMWRAGAWGVSSAASILRFHSAIGYPWTLTVFGLFAYAWVDAELRYAHAHPPMALLETAGRGSYSIYLMHRTIAAGYAILLLPPMTTKHGWLAGLSLVLIVSAIFFFVIEQPAHALARKLGTYGARTLASA